MAPVLRLASCIMWTYRLILRTTDGRLRVLHGTEQELLVARDTLLAMIERLSTEILTCYVGGVVHLIPAIEIAEVGEVEAVVVRV